MRKITTSTWGRELWKNQTQPSVFKGNMQVSSFIKQIIHKIKCLLRKLKMLMLIDVLQNLQSKRTSWLSIISRHIKQRGDANLLLKIYWDIVAVFKCTVHMREISWHIYRNIYHTLFKKKKGTFLLFSKSIVCSAGGSVHLTKMCSTYTFALGQFLSKIKVLHPVTLRSTSHYSDKWYGTEWHRLFCPIIQLAVYW